MTGPLGDYLHIALWGLGRVAPNVFGQIKVAEWEAAARRKPVFTWVWTQLEGRARNAREAQRYYRHIVFHLCKTVVV